MVFGGMVLGMAGLLGSIGIMHMHARAGWSPWWLTLTLLVLGVGQGLVVSPNQTLSLADVPLEYAGAAGGILQTGERIGASIGIAVITGLTFRVSHSSGWEVAAQADLLAVVATIAVAGRRVIRVGRVMVLGGMVLGMAGLLGSIGIMHMHARAGWR